MKFMKAKTICVTFIVLLTVFSLSSCVTVARQVARGRISDELIIAPDPNNPFQGTWMDSSKNYFHVIEGMNGAWYGLGAFSYQKNTVYIIERSGNGYVTSTDWRIRVDGDILTVGNQTYQRVVR